MWHFPNFLSTESLFHGLSLKINVLWNTLRSTDEAYRWQLVPSEADPRHRSCPVAETGPAAGRRRAVPLGQAQCPIYERQLRSSIS